MAIPAPLRPVVPYLAAVLFFLATCLNSVGTSKGATLICILLALAATGICFSRLRDRITLPLIALALVVLMDGISISYALSGKFALYEFMKVLLSFCLAVVLLAFTPGDGVLPGRRIASVLERGTALAGLVKHRHALYPAAQHAGSRIPRAVQLRLRRIERGGAGNPYGFPV